MEAILRTFVLRSAHSIFVMRSLIPSCDVWLLAALKPTTPSSLCASLWASWYERLGTPCFGVGGRVKPHNLLCTWSFTPAHTLTTVKTQAILLSLLSQVLDLIGRPALCNPRYVSNKPEKVWNTSLVCVWSDQSWHPDQTSSGRSLLLLRGDHNNPPGLGGFLFFSLHLKNLRKIILYNDMGRIK